MNTVDMLVYCPKLSSRTIYILELLLGKTMGISYSVTNVVDEFEHHEGPRLNYSSKAFGAEPFLEASELLFEDQVIDQSEALGQVIQWKGLPIFFPVKQNSILPFDIFSAAFYLVSRYEEHLPFKADPHGRFPSSESFAFQNNFLDKPIINLWALHFGEILQSIFGSDFPIRNPEYCFIPTIDIDNAWAFKHKGIRGLGAFVKKGQSMEDRNYRYQVLRGKQTDPYDRYLLLERLFKKHQLDPVYFFLSGRLGTYDRNVSPGNKAFIDLTNSISKEFRVGIHPSYASNEKIELVEKEIEVLESICKQKIHCSRQHFLKLHLPQTYKNLIQLGIKEDYSMGYADQPGFRAGLAQPFHFFDLESNKTTGLTVYPFQVMDVTLRDYLNLKPAEAINRIAGLIDQTRAVGGTFSCLWHNESLSEWKTWTGWSGVFREMLELAV